MYRFHGGDEGGGRVIFCGTGWYIVLDSMDTFKRQGSHNRYGKNLWYFVIGQLRDVIFKIFKM